MTLTSKIAFHTLGCKLNYSESSTLARMLEKDGFTKVPFEDNPDIFVINTCSVTENADKECKTIVKRARRINKDAKVVVIGCYAQLKPHEIASIEGVDMVLGAKEKFELAHHLNTLKNNTDTKQAVVFNCNIDEVNVFQPGYSIGDRTRAFLKVQDGCDFPCTYCTIPLARGRSRSGTVEETLQEVTKLAAHGMREIVLTGVNTGDFGINAITGERTETFYDLVQALDKVKGINRFRISSIEPNLLTDEIIDFVAQSILFVPHFHIPLQSGSNKILGLMRRRYRTDIYERRIQRIKQWMPHCAIGVDVITGFPGETETDFLDTYQFLNKLDISYLHVFTYSERPNTPAAMMADKVALKDRQERTHRLRILSEKKRAQFYNQHLNTIRPVLFESENIDGNMMGYTDNYMRVSMPYNAQYVNTIQQIFLEKFDGSTAQGSLHISETIMG